MKAPAHRSHRPIAALVAGIAAFAAVPVLAVAGTASSRATALPNPCTVLAAAHAERTIGTDKSAAAKPGKLSKYGTGALLNETCTETVGKIEVALSVAHNFGGFGGVKVTSTTHPGGLGAGDTLVVGTSPDGSKPVDFIMFHKASVYASISANGAAPASLTAFARQVYKLIH